MLELGRKLADRLAEMQVRINVPDANTVILHNVPANRDHFSKPRTNLLVKRPHEGMPFLVCVDEDLEYVGPDGALARIFSGGVRQRGWRTILFDPPPSRDLHDTVAGALAVLGFDGRPPETPLSPGPRAARAPGALLGALAVNLTERARAGKAQVTVGRSEEIDDAASCLLRWGQARLALVTGDSGVGKTNLLHGLARKLSEARPQMELLSLDLGALFAGTLFDAERENLLVGALNEAAPENVVLALEHLERAAPLPHAHLVLARRLDSGARIVGTTLPCDAERIAAYPLDRRLHVVELAEPSAAETAQILLALRDAMAAHHALQIDDPAIYACVKACRELPGCMPAKAIQVLDAAAAAAALAGVRVVSLDDILVAAERIRART